MQRAGARSCLGEREGLQRLAGLEERLGPDASPAYGAEESRHEGRPARSPHAAQALSRRDRSHLKGLPLMSRLNQ